MNAPARIASLLSSATEMLFALQLGDRVVGVSHECDFPIAARSKPRVTQSRIDSRQSSAAIDEQVRSQSATGESLYTIDAALLRTLRPELIVTQAQCDVCAVKLEDVLDLIQSEPALRDTRVLAFNPASFEDVLADLQQLGAATGCVAAAAELVASLRRRVAAVRGKTASLPATRRPRVACIEWVDPLMLAGNWTPQLIDWAGGRSEPIRGSQRTPPLKDEHSVGRSQDRSRPSMYRPWSEVITYDPEVLIVAPCGFDLVRARQESERLPQHPGWKCLSAVRNARVFALDGNAYLNRSGPRLVETLEILAHLIQPQLFPALPAAIDPATSVCRLDGQK